MANDRIRLCLVGTGSIGRRHLRLLSERDDVLLCAAEANPVSRDAVKEAFPSIPVYASMEEAMAREDLDAVAVATPHEMHADMTVRALEAGLHVFCEKPMSSSMEDCVRMLRAANESSRILSIGYMFRFDPFVQKMKEIVSSGTIGEIVHYESRFATYNTLLCSVTHHQEHTPYSLVMDCIHDSDLLYYFTGRIPDFAYSSAYQVKGIPLMSDPNMLDTVYRYRDVPMGAHIHFNYVQHPQIHTVQITGDRGYILGDFMSADIIVGTREGGTMTLPAQRGDFNDAYRNEWDRFFRAIRGECAPENPPEQAIVSTLLMYSQIESARTGQETDIRAIAERFGYHPDR